MVRVSSSILTILAIFSMLALTACGGSGAPADGGSSGVDAGRRLDAGSSDAGPPDADVPPCTSDSDCDDGLYCTGVERCIVGAPGTDARGCAVLSTPCPAASVCDEAMHRCLTNCSADRDADGDGHDSVDCGGDDCDDSDPNRYPGNEEVCDTADHDEDCDPMTFGARDTDGDGSFDDRCCNVDDAGMRYCGDDCDDTMSSIHPGQVEICDGLDQDCDGMIDEGAAMGTYYPDCDGDGYGDSTESSVMGCAPAEPPTSCGGIVTATWAPIGTDCDDTRSAVHPTAAELCNGRDDDCNGAFDGPGEDDDGDGYADATCGGDDCDDDCASCHPGGGPELCDGRDQDCDTMIDEGIDPSLETTYYHDADHDGVGDSTTARLACVPPGAHWVTAAADCNDAEPLTGACAAPMHCTTDHVCGCEASIWNNADYLDLETGAVSRGHSNSASDIYDYNGTLSQQYVHVQTGVSLRHYSTTRYVDVDASYTSGLSAMSDTQPFTSDAVIVIHTGSGHFFKLAYPSYIAYDGAMALHFTYAPIGGAPAGFACMM